MPLSLEASFPESPDGVFWAGEQLVMTIVVRNDGELPPQTPRMARRRSSGRGGDLVNPFGPEFRDADGQKGDTDAPVGDKRSGTLEAGGYLVRAGTASSTDGSIAGDGTNGDASGQRKPGLISSVVRSVGRGALSLLGLGGSPTEEPGTPTSPSDPSNLHGLPEAPMASPVSPGRDPDIPARSDSFSRALPPAPQLGTVEQPPTVIKLAPVNTALERIDEVRSGSSTPGGPGSPAPSEASFRPPLPLLPAPASLRKLVPTAASGTEQLTYGFVQMVGTLQPDPNSISLAPFGTLKSRAMYFPSSGQHGGGGSLVANTGPRTKDDRAIPVYSTPPSILFVDLNLAPGESKTYRYSLILPEVLPPSHRGRLARFSYKLVIGIQRGAINTRTQNFQVPFRLFSRVEGVLRFKFPCSNPSLTLICRGLYQAGLRRFGSGGCHGGRS